MSASSHPTKNTSFHREFDPQQPRFLAKSSLTISSAKCPEPPEYWDWDAGTLRDPAFGPIPCSHLDFSHYKSMIYGVFSAKNCI